MLICTFYIAILVPYNFATDDDEAENVFQLFYRGERSLCAPSALPAALPAAASSVLVATAASSRHAALAFPSAALNKSFGENASATADGGGGGGGGGMARFKNLELLRVLDVAVEGLFICGARALAPSRVCPV